MASRGSHSRGSHRICEICGVRERHNEKPEHSLFATFPLNEERCRDWLRLVGNEELVHLPIEKLNKKRHVCGKHFQKKDFNKKGNRLKKHAIPVLHLTAAALSDEQLSTFPQYMWKDTAAPVLEEPQPSTSKGTNVDVAVEQLLNAPVLEEPQPSTSKGTNVDVAVEQLLNAPVLEEPQPSTSKGTNVDVAVMDLLSGDQAKVVKRKLQESIAPVLEEPQPSTSKGTNVDVAVEQLLNAPVPEELPSTSKGTHVDVAVMDLLSGDQAKVVKRKLQESIDLTPRKKKLVQQLVRTKCTLQSLRKSAILVEKIDSPILREFVQNACKNQKRKPQGRRWTIKNKISALAIFKRSPKTYRYLCEVMPLPSEKTLQMILKKMPMQPGINGAVLNHLKSIAEDRDIKQKTCCLLFDEMAIKPRLIFNMATDLVEGFEDLGEHTSSRGHLADHALVFMLQGLYQKFKQPIAFFFVKGTISSEKLSMLIKTIINQVTLTGFNIINTVCDQGPTNIGALKLLRDHSGPREDGSDHYFVLNDQKIFIIYDVPHLFKSLRNNFQKNGTILFNGKKAQWIHIREMEEKNRNFLYLSKITPTHVDPKFRAKMKVKYAAQILSNTVAAVLKLLSQANKDHQHANELMDTALVIEELDHLFDYTNGPSCPDNIKKGQRENVSRKTVHFEQWTRYIKILSALKFLDHHGNEARNVKCVNGYITTLKSFRDIWQHVSGLGFKYLNLRQLNQDALENLFGIIRQHSPTNRNPTCAHFIGALKTAVITKLTAPHSRGSNCEKDAQNLLTDLSSITFNKTEEFGTQEINEEVCDSEFPIICIPEDVLEEDDLADILNQPIVYISGYLACQILKKSDCETCKKYLTAENTDPRMYSYIQLREWWPDKTSLTYPSEQLCRTIQTAVTVTEEEVCPRLHEKNICQLAVTLYTVKCDTSWFGCILHKDLILRGLFNRLGLLLIRRQCQRVNQGLAMKEERIADAQKIAQQQGLAK